MNPHPVSTQQRLGLLEDDPVTAEMLELSLAEEGFAVTTFGLVADLTTALNAGNTFDVLLLDWSLPDGTAAHVLATVRNELNLATPVLIASVMDDEATIVGALQRGADDYVVKPLRIAEVKARLLALLRRSTGAMAPVLAWGRYAFDPAKAQLTLDGEPIALTPREFELAAYLFKHAGQLLSRERLLQAVWGLSGEVETRTVDAHVARLRQKLTLGPESGVCLLTEHGLGYRLMVDTDG